MNLRMPQLKTLRRKVDSIDSSELSTIRAEGYISKMVGLTVESKGPLASVGDLVAIQSQGGRKEYWAEVVGFREGNVLLLPYDDINGVRSEDRVILRTSGFRINVGEKLLGRVIDSLGRPVDEAPPLKEGVSWAVSRSAPSSMRRRRIDQSIECGVRTVDGLLTCGCGQRMGIFSGSGVGKSTLLGMISRNSASDVNVIALIGERGKEVRDFIEEALGREGLEKSVLVVVTSDKSPLQRVKGAETAMAVAEYFRDQGKNVLFVMDSATRLAMAQREVGLAAGEPPATRGYPPSVFALLPRLFERAGRSDKGSITAFITVLVEGDDMNEPIADAVRGILDGHIVLSRDLAEKGHFPAIDPLQSISRVMNDVTSEEHQQAAREIRELLSVYKDSEDMINIGAYNKGTNERIDRAIDRKPQLDAFLQQGRFERTDLETTLNWMREILES